MQSPMNFAKEFKQMKGTTGVALRFRDGAIVAADRRASMGTLVASKRAKKVHFIADNIGVGIAGLVSDAMMLVDLMKAELKLYELENGYKASVRVASSLLGTILYGGYRRYFPYWVQLLVAGVDKTGPHVYSLDLSGAVSEEDYFSIGSGSPMALGILEMDYNEDLTKDDAVALAKKALMSAIGRDTATGNGIDGIVFQKDQRPETFSITLGYQETSET